MANRKRDRGKSDLLDMAWVLDRARTPLVFLGLWGLGLFGFLSLGLGSHIFMGFQAILALTLAIINGYRVPPLS